jgi:hypothetical protein
MPALVACNYAKQQATEPDPMRSGAAWMAVTSTAMTPAIHDN